MALRPMAASAEGLSGLFRLFAPQIFSSSYSGSQNHASSSSIEYRPLASLLSTQLFPPIQIKIPSLIREIWEGILRAVPKKKTSHRKKRQRFMAGKGLKDVTSLNRCSACGAVKRAHLLCPMCVREIKDMWLGKAKPKAEAAKAEVEPAT